MRTWTATPDSRISAYPCEFHRPPAEGGASAANILCIGATDRNDVLATFSNHGTSAVHLGRARASGILQRLRRRIRTVVSENFEGTVAPVQRALGQPHAQPEPVEPHGATRTSGAFSIADSPVGVSVNQDTSIAKLASFSLAGRTGCRINYNMRLNTENPSGNVVG